MYLPKSKMSVIFASGSVQPDNALSGPWKSVGRVSRGQAVGVRPLNLVARLH